ncbi:MAG: hypothetical protein Ta2E_05350 [Mycoplasmoidaceae bacterium]|nr:MAG: hypothetical protein Ta2E_05350 [Mycoplasmoidaceae bacterium]
MSEKNKVDSEGGAKISLDPLAKTNININDNVGKFASTTPAARHPADGTVEKTVGDEKKNKKEVKINFKKFETSKNYGNGKIGKFKTFLENKLNKKQYLLLIWGIYGLILSVCLTLCVCFIVYNNKFLNDTTRNYNNFKDIVNCGKTGYIIGYIAILLPSIPLFVLFITWLIQINGVYKSVSFHFMTIVIFCIVLLLLLISTILSSVYIQYASYKTLL